jgi:hypothetical protein
VPPVQQTTSEPDQAEDEPDQAEDGTPSVQAAVTVDWNDAGGARWVQVSPTGGVTFNDWWSVEVGLPIYYLGGSSTDDGASLTGIGDLYASLYLDLSGDSVTAWTAGTIGAPTGDADTGLGAGTTTWDASVYLDRAFGKFTPSVYAGVGNNSLAATSNAGRQLYRSSGYLVHVEGWAEVEVWKALSLSAGLYVVRDNASDDTVDDEGYDASIDDEGFQFVATSTLTRSLELSFWYTRSHAYASNTYSVSLGVDIAGLFRKSGTSAPGRKRIRR